MYSLKFQFKMKLIPENFEILMIKLKAQCLIHGYLIYLTPVIPKIWNMSSIIIISTIIFISKFWII